MLDGIFKMFIRKAAFQKVGPGIWLYLFVLPLLLSIANRNYRGYLFETFSFLPRDPMPMYVHGDRK